MKRNLLRTLSASAVVLALVAAGAAPAAWAGEEEKSVTSVF